jgi:hypothetical protein
MLPQHDDLANRELSVEQLDAIAAQRSLPAVSYGGVLSDCDMQKVETLKPLFANLMTDLSQSARQTDVAAGDLNCISSTIQGAPSPTSSRAMNI